MLISDGSSDVFSSDLTARVQAGENVVVFGLGGIGLNVIQGAKMVGAGRIIGVDINPDREAWGRKFGMTHFLNSKGLSREETIAKVIELTDGGADYSFDATGNRSEEHTSELQSLMRTSYAVFCLKKKKKTYRRKKNKNT